VLFAFHLLFLDGKDLRRLSLRKLRQLILPDVRSAL
jgi:ATP-dependent DNA ligase